MEVDQLDGRDQFRWRGIKDWTLIACAAMLGGFGLLIILSATSLRADELYGNALHFAGRQGIALLLGTLAGAAVIWLPWSWLRRGVWPVYILTIIALVLVLTPLGHSANGAARWIHLGPVNVQPSEVAKLAMILLLAHYLSCNEGRLRDVMGVVAPGLALAVPILLLILFQRDFGATVVLLGLIGVMFFIAGLQLRYLLAMGGVAGSYLGFLIWLEPYRWQRITSFMDPYADQQDAGYQIVQGWIALATGGWFGQGMASGLAQRGFLPEAHTDMIMAVVGEELGAVGWVLVIGLLTVLVWRAFMIAAKASDLFGLLTASGIAVMFASQAIINVGVVVGWVPPKGLVLPFLSYGASAAVIHTLCIGLLLRIGADATLDNEDTPLSSGQVPA